MKQCTLSVADLATLEKPARYVGDEVNMVRKEGPEITVRMALAFPDLYEIGMSHLGSKILYELVNALPWAALERVYAPWADMEALLRKGGQPLATLESSRALSEFDFIGFSLQYELSYSNIVNMLDLGGIPLHSQQRSETDPLVIAGGPGAFNPEPIANFLDFVVLGDAEEVLPRLLKLYSEMRVMPGYSRVGFLRAVAKLDGIYVPAFYQAEYGIDGSFTGMKPLCTEAALPVRRAIVADLNTAAVSDKPLLPYIEVVHDRAMLELFRGCTNGCRFCQAGILYRPVRERGRDELLQQAEVLIQHTGYDEISLTSLSSMDYTRLSELVDDLLERYATRGIGLALSSLRVDSFSIELAQRVQQVRKSGLTLAPEAGSQRLRDRINKNVSEEQILAAVGGAFKAGWSSLKLYFMIGLPGEEDSDLEAIVALTRQIANLYRQLKPKQRLRLAVSVSPFVPKPHTPFQWSGQIPLEEIARRQQFLRQNLREIRGLEFSSHDRHTSFLEAAFSRGDRSLSSVIAEAWRRGARFDGWSECFALDIWLESFAVCGLNATTYAEKNFELEAALPWDHLDSGVGKAWLRHELQKASAAETTPDCRFGICSGCGVCPGYGLSNRFAGEVHR